MPLILYHTVVPLKKRDTISFSNFKKTLLEGGGTKEGGGRNGPKKVGRWEKYGEKVGRREIKKSWELGELNWMRN